MSAYKFYVSYFANGGGAGSKADPFTFAEALAYRFPSDSQLLIKSDGIYDHNAYFTFSGDYLRITGYGVDDDDGVRAHIRLVASALNFWAIGTDDMVENFIVEDYGKQYVSQNCLCTGRGMWKNVIALNSNVHGFYNANTYGCIAYNPRYDGYASCSIEYCLADSCRYGFYTANNSIAINCTRGFASGRFNNCISYNNTYAWTSDVIATNCIIANNTYVAFAYGNTQVYKCNFWNNTNENIVSRAKRDCISVDPGFIDPNNYDFRIPDDRFSGLGFSELYGNLYNSDIGVFQIINNLLPLGDLESCIDLSDAVYDSDRIEGQRFDANNNPTELSFKVTPDYSGELFMFDCSSFSGWSKTASGAYGTVDAAVFDGETVFKFERVSGWSGVSQYANINVGASLLPLSLSLTMRMYIELVGTLANNTDIRLILTRNDLRLYLTIGEDEIYVRNSAGYNLIEYTVPKNEWFTIQIVRTALTAETATCDIYINGTRIISNFDCSDTGSFTDGFFEIRQYAYSTAEGTLGFYIDNIECLGVNTFPTVAIISSKLIDTNNEGAIHNFDTLNDINNPNGEDGTIEYQYAISNTFIPDYEADNSLYNGTWLTLEELIAIGPVTGRYRRIAWRLSGNGVQDATKGTGCMTVSIPIPLEADYPETYDVRNLITFDHGNKVGTAFIPSASDTRLGVDVDNTKGNVVLPIISDVRELVGYGALGTEYYGTFEGEIPDYPDENDVRELVSYAYGTLVGNLKLTTANNLRAGIGIGSNGVEVIGNILLTTAGNIALGVGLGALGTEIIGNHVDANPELVLVENGDYGNPDNPTTPRWEKADVQYYREGRTFGTDGISEEGELEVGISAIIYDEIDLEVGTEELIIEVD